MEAELVTTAEKLADSVRTLPNFKDVSLPGIKVTVAQILSLISRDGFFSTYTRHDITHIDAMLKMLDWMVPNSTKSIMTPVDWLLIVLAIYLHDLGLVATTQEFDRREANPEFASWRNSLDKSDEGREYLARMNRMTAIEKETFLFQEFIRKGHAKRIRDWTVGNKAQICEPLLTPIAQAVGEILSHFPSRFRDYLGLVCESHHSNNLDKTDIYPLVARFGNDPAEFANIQYAAILLRSADLLHVTADRTPSVMFKSIKFSDPKSVIEWEKQLGTFAVGPKGRGLVEGDPDSAVIVLNADFTDERPLFSLQEYVAYADSQIIESKRWIDKSRDLSDGKDFSFPWHNVVGDVRLEGVPPLPMRFELDRGRLLDLLVGHTIYNEPTVAIRELLQNGIDAVRYQHYVDESTAKTSKVPTPTIGKVYVTWDPRSRNLVVQDNGIGMDRDIIDHHLMNVGSSYYNTPQFEAEHGGFVPISRFGIGILTCFMVSDDIEIVTHREGKGFRIRMTSVKSTYLLREIHAGDRLLEGINPHGTRVTLRLRDTIDLAKRSILDILRYWVILPECSVEYCESGKDPVRIGFDSIVDALRSFSLPSEPGTGHPSERVEVVVKSRGELSTTSRGQQGMCQLAFGVHSEYYPERSFVITKNSEVPKVCIEGIRVSESLPGFGAEENLVALLVVSGSRKFRTTVSRSGLEIDDEYIRVASICADMLFEHVNDEADRISLGPGRPLSQAASGCQYLVRQLKQVGFRGYISDRIEKLVDSARTIVVERVDSEKEKPITNRELISPSELRKIPTFWTIESRCLDSLGVISLDLGRELSLNDFLLALAPDATQLRYSPILPEAHFSAWAICSSHYPKNVEFSRKHQQTAINWILRSGPPETGIDLSEFATRGFISGVHNAMEKEGVDPEYYTGRRHGLYDFLRGNVEIFFADISGDDSQIVLVPSRMGAIIQRGSDISEIWTTLRQAARKLAMSNSYEELVITLIMADVFRIHCSDIQSAYRQPGSQVWRLHVSSLREILSELKMTDNLPDDLAYRIPRQIMFNASSFWRDWGRLSMR
jgi:molecular chaperone HtpG